MSDKTSDKTSDKLLPCPFCGGEAKIITQNSVDECYGVRCTKVGCVAFDILPCYSEKAEAIAAWNTRKPMERVVERLENASYMTECTFDEDGWSNNDNYEVVLLDEAIEIVKGEM